MNNYVVLIDWKSLGEMLLTWADLVGVSKVQSNPHLTQNFIFTGNFG